MHRGGGSTLGERGLLFTCLRRMDTTEEKKEGGGGLFCACKSDFPRIMEKGLSTKKGYFKIRQVEKYQRNREREGGDHYPFLKHELWFQKEKLRK